MSACRMGRLLWRRCWCDFRSLWPILNIFWVVVRTCLKNALSELLLFTSGRTTRLDNFKTEDWRSWSLRKPALCLFYYYEKLSALVLSKSQNTDAARWRMTFVQVNWVVKTSGSSHATSACKIFRKCGRDILPSPPGTPQVSVSVLWY